MNFLLGMFGGHFSPILGILDVDDKNNNDDDDDNDEATSETTTLVAVFDTNDKYDGTYFVSAKRLYEAVRAVDLSAHKHRALILVTKEQEMIA